MDSNIKKENERMKQQLDGFRKIHELLMELRGNITEKQKGELVCRYFRSLSMARETTLFMKNLKSDRYHYRAASGKEGSKYSGGYLDMGGLDLLKAGRTDLTAAPSPAITVHTRKEKYDFHDKFVAAVPVRAFSKVYGVLFCEYDNSFSLDDKQREEIITVFLDQISLLFECNAETEQFQDKARSLELLYEIGSKLSNIRNEDALLEAILNLIQQNLQVDRCSLMIIDEERKYLRIKKAVGRYDIDVSKVRVPIGEGIAGHVAVGTRPLLIKDLSSEKHLISHVPKKHDFRTNSLLSVPLVSQGEVIGVINVNNRKDGMPFSEADMDLLTKIASEIAAILKRSYISLQLKKARELDSDIKKFMA
jgi:putative methionine-R-sulfoxide reductase with GAF domain